MLDEVKTGQLTLEKIKTHTPTNRMYIRAITAQATKLKIYKKGKAQVKTSWRMLLVPNQL